MNTSRKLNRPAFACDGIADINNVLMEFHKDPALSILAEYRRLASSLCKSLTKAASRRVKSIQCLSARLSAWSGRSRSIARSFYGDKGRAGQGRAGQGWAEQGRAGQGREWKDLWLVL